MPKPMPPIKASVAKQNPAIEKTQVPNEESAKLAAGQSSKPRPSSMKEAAMAALGKPAKQPAKERPKSMREAVSKAAKKGKEKK
jgi:aspartate/methionine/tyrosine aminotransferase